MAEILSWTVHRAREARAKTAVTAVFILAFVIFSWFVFGPVLAILAVVVFFLALNTYFLPVTYTFSDKGIEVDKRLFTTSYEWKQFRRWFRTTGGIVVSPFSRKSYLDNFRGVHLLLPARSGRMSNYEARMMHRPTGATEADGQQTANSVQTEDIVAYLERRFAPPPPDERLKLDEPDEAGSEKLDQ